MQLNLNEANFLTGGGGGYAEIFFQPSDFALSKFIMSIVVCIVIFNFI